MTRPNPLRGEIVLQLSDVSLVLRPTFGALVAAEGEIGSLFSVLERAGESESRLSDMGALFWHCLADPKPDADRASFEAALLGVGVAALLPSFRALLSSVFGGT